MIAPNALLKSLQNEQDKALWRAVADVAGKEHPRGLSNLFYWVQGGAESLDLCTDTLKLAKRLSMMEDNTLANSLATQLVKRIKTVADPAQELAIAEIIKSLHHSFIEKMLTRTKVSLQQTAFTAFEDAMAKKWVPIFKAAKIFEDGAHIMGLLPKAIPRIATAIRQTKKYTEVSSEGIPEISLCSGSREVIALDEITPYIQKLPAGYRKVLELDLEGYSHKEISQQLGIGESTSRSQLTKARKLLAERLPSEFSQYSPYVRAVKEGQRSC
jgi:DNA-directed RNA polymerase specialized sigma24 family protein